MRKNLLVVIPVIIAIIVSLTILLIPNDDQKRMEVEDTLDKEIDPEFEENPEVQEKLDEVEKINLENEYSPKEREWKTSGPFSIDRSKYAIGEKIFLVIGDLAKDEKGQAAFMRPLNATHYSVYLTIPFDGEKKSEFNYYLNPQISKTRGICSVDDIAGMWTIVFRGTDYPNLDFEITKDIVPGTDVQSVC